MVRYIYICSVTYNISTRNKEKMCQSMEWCDTSIVRSRDVLPLPICMVDSADTFSQDALGRKWRGLQPYHFTQHVLYLGTLSHNCWLDKIYYFPWNKNNCFQHCKIEFYWIFFHSTVHEHNVLGTHTKRIAITWQYGVN